MGEYEQKMEDARYESLRETVQAVVKANKIRHDAAIAMDKAPSDKEASRALRISLKITKDFWESVKTLEKRL